MKKVKKVTKKVTKVSRRSPMARALEEAQTKYTKALVEWEKCLGRVAILKIEIPRLEEIVRVLGGTTSRRLNGIPGPSDGVIPESGELDQTKAILSNPLTERVATGPIPLAVNVPPHLAKMIKEHPLIQRGGEVQGQAEAVDLSKDV